MIKMIVQLGEMMLGYAALVGLVLLVSHILGINLPKALIDFSNVIMAQLGL